MGIPQSHFQLPMFQYFREKVLDERPCQDTLKVMSWNILAERLVSSSQFPYVEPQYLDYHYRINITKRLIELANCSILALQEVDPTKSFFSFLSSMGYDYQYRPKGCFQGILIAYKRDEFELLDWKIVDYDSHISHRFRRFPYATGHGALLAKLLYKGKYKIVVENTHLHWVPKHEKVKYHQTCSGLAELAEFSKDDPECFKLFLGDFNSLPDCNGVRLVTTNEPPVDLPKYEGSTFKEICIKYQEYKDRLIKLKSVFRNPEDGSFTNVTDKFIGAIDYVYYEESDKFQVKSLYQLPSEEVVRRETALPNSEFPSDHFPLICSFGLKS